MPRSAERPTGRALVAAALLAAALSGCSDLYLDRRETVALGADDFIAVNRVTHMVDPWPPGSANRNYLVNGDKMQSAVERYRTGKIIEPKGTTTSKGFDSQGGSQSGGAAGATPVAGSSSK